MYISTGSFTAYGTAAGRTVFSGHLIRDDAAVPTETIWQDWTPTFAGWSANPTNSVYRYTRTGKVVTLAIRQGTDGTSNAVTATISLPYPAATIANMHWMVPAAFTDNGSFQAAPGRARIGSGDTVLTLGKAWNADGGFTASGGKKVDIVEITYECA
jgi:hypothetical protein